MTEKQQALGAIWLKNGDLSMKLGDDNILLKKVTDKTNEKYPDYKSDDLAAWEKVSKNGNEYLFMKDKEKQYVAFKNGFKTEDKHPDYRVFESKPLDA